ncbi:unnamed protein product, partial [Prunus brigantina]
MKPIARSLSILASMIATRLGAKLRLFCAIGLQVGLTWTPPSWLGLGASRSALFCLAGQDPRVLTRSPLRVSILLQERPLDGFPRLGPDTLIAIREQDSV